MRIGAYQFAISGDVNENYKEIEKAIYLAKNSNALLYISFSLNMVPTIKEISFWSATD